MRGTRQRFGVAAGLLLVPFAPGSARDATKPEDQAKDAAIQFATAFNDRSVDGMMKVAGVPFFYQPRGTPMGSNFAPSPVVKTEADLRAKLKEKLPGTLPTDIDRVVSYKDQRTKLLVGGDDLKALDQVAGTNGWVVMVTEKGTPGVVPIIVAVEDGRARVVSFLWTWARAPDPAPKR